MSYRPAVCVVLLLAIACSKSERPAAAAASTRNGDPLTDDALGRIRYATTLAPAGGAAIDTTQDAADAGGAQRTSIVLTARGDLSGDNKPEAVVVLFSDSGESGKFLDLVPVFEESSGARAGRRTFLGDRVRPDSLWVSGGRVNLRIVTHGPSDPACCPGQPEEHRYRLLGDSLALEEKRLLATPDSITD
jgi:hypothetical protein